MRLNRFFGVFQIVVVLALVAVASLYACRPNIGSEAGGPQLPASAATRSSQKVVTIIRPQVVSATIEVEATGSFRSRAPVAIVPQVGGRVIWVSPKLRNGGEFEADEPMFRLDPIDAELNVRQAKADLQVAYAEMNLTEAEREASTENYRLLNPNAEIPALVAREPQLERSKASVERTKARLLIAELALSRTEFSFPFPGRVLEANIAVGQLLSPNQSVGQVFNVDDVEAVIPLSGMDLATIEPAVGRRVLMNVDDELISGTVERIAAQLDSRTRTSTLFVHLDGPGELGLPGRFISAQVFGQTIDRAFVLPEQAQQVMGNVWIVRDGALLRVPIKVRDHREDGLLVEAFDYHDGIVVDLLPDAAEGDPVQIAGSTSS